MNDGRIVGEDPRPGDIRAKHLSLRIAERFRHGLLAALLLAAGATGADEPHLALGRPAAQSSTFEQAAAALAVDGNPDGDYQAGSVALTHRDPYPYWWVDLGAATEVGSVVVHGRTDAHANRLDQFILVALPEGPSPAVDPVLSTLAREQLADPAFTPPEGWAVHKSDRQFTADEPSETVVLEGAFRYLFVLLPRADYLQLAEVEVWPPK